MKKILTLLTLAVVTLCSLSSCSEDDEIGLTLEGTWHGNMYITTQYGDHNYACTETTIQFTTQGLRASKGSGYWVDYYSNAPWDYVASHITWRVRDAVIYVHFVEDNTDVEIRDFKLNSSQFNGWINYNYQNIFFSFVPDNTFDYDDYRYGGYTYYGNGWYYNQSGDKPDAPVRHFGKVE